MKALLVTVCVALVAAPAALAKGRIDVVVADRTPRAGHAFAVDVRTGFVVPPDDWLRLVAVAPGKSWFDVVGRVTGAASSARVSIPRDGFAIPLRRVAPKHWRAVVRLPSPGRWRLVLPNGTHVGFMTPPPAAWMPWVQVRR
jgi:hypothetical protein